MNTLEKYNPIAKAVRLAIVAASAISVFSVPTVFSAEAEQQALSTASVEVENDGLEEGDDGTKLVITGSRIRRSEFSSASPIQIVSGEVSRELGLFSAADMLQELNQSAGAQIDSSYGGLNIDNGPGSATIGFRGLGPERTLVLINGRRMVSAGAGGAPAAADLNLIPGVMIDRIENLFDGASTIYGSDAVAGVANVILKTDVEGFQFEGNFANPISSGGENNTLSGMYGKTFDNGFINFGMEYSDQKGQTIGENDFTRGCDQNRFEDASGNLYLGDRTNGPILETEFNDCDIFPLTNRVFFANTFWGSLYRTPGSTNTGLPNYSETTVGFSSAFSPLWFDADSDGDGINDTVIVDGNGDGIRDVSFQDPFYAFNLSERAQQRHLLGQIKRFSFVLNGDYNFQDANDTKVYYEGIYARRNNDTFSGAGQIFPIIGVDNPFNPCGNLNYTPATCGGGLADFGPSTAQPIVNIRGDRDREQVNVSQYRFTGGITGNINALEDFGGGNWFYDAYITYAKSNGEFKIQGIDSRLLTTSLASWVDTSGNIVCGDGTGSCVPVNFFADNIYAEGGGSFTGPEAQYLFTDRIAKTGIQQTVINAYISGDAYTLPWNDQPIAVVFGAEFREDKIATDSNRVATEGLLQSYFADQGASGTRSFSEFFFEAEAPLLRGQAFAEELTISAAARRTDETFYEAADVFNVKAVYRPIDWFTIRGTRGTSYRAPSVRDRFIRGNSGFTTITDPCVVPVEARISSDPNDLNAPLVYDPSLDEREQYTLDSCVANGVDPTTLGIGTGNASFTPATNIESTTSGTENLNPETSLSETYGIILEQPFSEDFELTISATHFDIDISDSIAEPSNGYVITQCLDNREEPNGGSAFCSQFDRNNLGRITDVRPGFINIGTQTSVGYDYNLFYNQDFLVGAENLGVTLDIQATKMEEQFIDVLGTTDDNVGEKTVPEWRATARLALSYNDFRFNWRAQFIGSGLTDEEFLSDFEVNSACQGLSDANGDPVLCREIDYTPSYVNHSASFSWLKDNFAVTLGVRNVFNTPPPKVDDDLGGGNILRNIPLGVGYDILGRTIFLNFSAEF